MNNGRFEWCTDCKAIDNGEIKDFCRKHFIPNHNGSKNDIVTEHCRIDIKDFGWDLLVEK